MVESEFFVRLGNWGDVICCDLDADAMPTQRLIQRGQRVICRTARGLELGTVSACLKPSDESEVRTPPAAKILRPTTVEDELWIARLEKERLQAVQECRQLLAESGSTAVLLDVDQLFDSATLIFYFLEPVDQEVAELVDDLAQRFESRVRTQHFAELVEQGCGSGCGTASDTSQSSRKGHGCSRSCAMCVVAKR